MCGVAGLIGKRGENKDVLTNAVGRMTDILRHRGPDDAGLWVDADVGVALGHRRLSIVDLSPEGHQPMVSNCGRFVIVFNGEIYNHREIRAQLDSESTQAWRGHSDTEVLLQACALRGVEQALQRSIGMFAFALWDRRDRTLTLARDRLGEKPLYYGWQGETFLFGSELKALRAHPGFNARIDRDVLTLFLRYNYIPEPHTIYSDIFKLPPATYLTLSVDSLREAKPRTYWSARDVAERGQQKLFNGSLKEAVDELERKLEASVASQMLADVPLGAFLSGGIDSSTIVALMQGQSSRPVRTFSIGFWNKEYNEAEHAKQVAAHLGTDHTEFYVSEQDALSVVPRLPEMYDEPFADSSQIPTFLVSQLARKSVTVALSGDGGDELFGGYNRYFLATKLWRTIRAMPAPFRTALAAAMTGPSPQTWNGVVNCLGWLLPASWRYRSTGDKLHKLADVINKHSPATIYFTLLSHWKQPEEVVLSAREPSSPPGDTASWPSISEIEHQMMYLDTVGYLPGDILTKLDRAAMRVSMETRVPFLDHRVVEFAWQLPLEMKIRAGQGKCVLRELLIRHVPKKLVDRPKMGFGVPLDTWLRGPLREWAEALIDESRLRREGYLRPEPIRTKWIEHLRGDRNWAYLLWDVLMFQAWLEKNRP